MTGSADPSPSEVRDHLRLRVSFTEAESASAARRAELIAELERERPGLGTQLVELLRAAERCGGFLEPPVGDPVAILAVMGAGPPGSDGRPRPSCEGAAEPRVPLRLGGYRLDRLIGRGAFADVFEAWSELPPERRVALKVLRTGFLDDERRWRLERECEALAEVAHRNVAMLLAAGVDDGRPWLAMEFVPGPTLGDWARAARPSPHEAAALLAAVCDGVHALHQRGVIHRDLKPGNIVVSDIDGAPTPKVIDLGLAVRLSTTPTDSCRTADGAMVGTLPYMAPELLAGGAVPWAMRGESRADVRGDIYSLGVVAFELLAGRLPFEDVTAPRNVPPRLRSAVRGCPRDLEAVVERALAPQREQRYGSAAALADDLRRAARGLPVSARPSGAVRRVALAVRRRPMAAVATAAGTALLCAVAVMQANRWREESRRLAVGQARLATLLDAVSDLAESPGSDGPVGEVAAVAARIVDELLTESPGDPALLREQARVLSGQANDAFRRSDFWEAQRRWQDALAVLESSMAMDAEPAVGLRLRSKIVVRLGDCARELGDRDTMLLRFRQALALDESLMSDRPDDPEAVESLVYSFERLADAARQDGDLESYRTWQARQGEAIERWTALTTESTGPRSARCRWLLQRAEGARHKDDHATALGHSDEALPIARELLLATGPTRSTVELLCWAAGARTEALSCLGRTDAALAQAGEMSPLLDELVRRDPLRDAPCSLLASQWWILAGVLERDGRTEDSVAALREALRLLRRAAELAPARADHRVEVGRGGLILANRLACLGREEDSLAEAGAALTMLEEAVRLWPTMQHHVLLSWAYQIELPPPLRDPTRAVALAQEAVRIAPASPIPRHRLAEALASAELQAQAAPAAPGPPSAEPPSGGD